MLRARGGRILHFPKFRPSRPGRPTAKHLVVVLLAVLVVVGGVMRADAIGTNQRVSADETAYASLGNYIAAGNGYYGQIHWAPGAPYVFALASLVSGETIRIAAHVRGPAQVAQLLIGLLTMALAGFGAWRLAGPLAAVLATAATAFYTPLILLTRTYLSEPLGGLTLLAMVLLASLAHRRRLGTVALAGIVAGLACLTRNDVAVAIPIIAVALALSQRGSGWRRGLLRGGMYVVCALLTIGPWVLYSSEKIHQFVPITTAGPTAFFIGTYLPADGALTGTVNAFKAPVCRAYPSTCAHYRADGPQLMFKLIASRYPKLSENAAITKAAIHNLTMYAGDHPLAYAKMLVHKAWRLWGTPWPGGGYHNESSRLQHLIFIGLAALGLFGGALFIRRWSLVTAAVVLLAVSGVNVLFVSESREAPRMIPLLFVYGAVGLCALVERVRGSRGAVPA